MHETYTVPHAKHNYTSKVLISRKKRNMASGSFILICACDLYLFEQIQESYLT